jgi:hypothetical protein
MDAAAFSKTFYYTTRRHIPEAIFGSFVDQVSVNWSYDQLIKQHVKKDIWGNRGTAPCILTSALGGSEWSSRLRRFT